MIQKACPPLKSRKEQNTCVVLDNVIACRRQLPVCWRGRRRHSDRSTQKPRAPQRRHTTYTISLAPSAHPGKVTATSSDGHTTTTTVPLLDSARYWQALGAPSSATIVTVWSSGSGDWALRSTIGTAAALSIDTNASRTRLTARTSSLVSIAGADHPPGPPNT